jgi:hypothetical protein
MIDKTDRRVTLQAAEMVDNRRVGLACSVLVP